MTQSPIPPHASYPAVRRRLRLGRMILLLLLGLSVVGAGTFAYYYQTSQTVRDATRYLLAGGLPEPVDVFGRGEVTVLVMGRDVDLDNRAQVMHTRGRTDLMMLVHLDFLRRQAEMLSIPRDTWVRIPGHGRHKINAAHAIGGPELAVDTVENLLGVRADGYLTVNYQAVAEAIDGLGGVDVTVDKPLHYDDNWGRLHIHLEPGPQHLTGEQAVGMARYRKSKTGEADSDLQRIERQQRLLTALRLRLRDPYVLLRLPAVVDRVRARLETNLSGDQLASLAAFTRQLPREQIHCAILPGQQRPTCIKPDLAAARAMAQEMFGP